MAEPKATCSRCGSTKADIEFAPSMRRPGGYCRICQREINRRHHAGEDTKDHLVPRTCDQCGEIYVPGRISNGKRGLAYCSRKCKDDARNAATASQFLEAKPTDRICLHCGEPMPQSMRADAKFCSARCNEAAHALQRKLRARTGIDDKPGFVRAFICDRDKWRCWLCRKPVDRKRQHPDPMCASLDHVKPVAEGGTNDLWNLRLAHLVCNLKRGAARGELLTLF